MHSFFLSLYKRFILVIFIWCILFDFNYVATESESDKFQRSEQFDGTSDGSMVNYELRNIEAESQTSSSPIETEPFRSSIAKKDHHVFELNGFEEYETIPVEFPIDICLMEINNVLYASCLQIQNRGNSNKTVLVLFKRIDRNAYETIFTHETNSAKSMDCQSMGSIGYVAIVNSVPETIYQDITEGSPVFQILNDRVNVVHFFATPFQHSVHLRKYGPNMFLFQTFVSKQNQICPIFQWTDSTFSLLDRLPCANAWRIEPFLIGSDIYIAIANNKNAFNDMDTYSFLYKFDIHRQKFKLAQKIKTFGATDLKFFHLINNLKNENFLIIANQYEDQIESNAREMDSIKSNAVIYKFNDEHFIPMQSIQFETPIKQFLPVLGNNSEFVLLVSLEDKATVTFQYNGWLFIESAIQFTGGSFDKGVSSLRTYKLNGENIIVVANTNMYSDATNLFLPRYLKTVPAAAIALLEDFDTWYQSITEKLQKNNLNNLSNKLNELQTIEMLNENKIEIKGLLRLTETHINTIKTNALNSPTFNFDHNKFAGLIETAEDILAGQAQALKQTRNNDENSKVLNATHLTVDHLTFDNINGHSKDDLVYRNKDLNVQEIQVDEVIFRNNNKSYETMLAKLQAQQIQSKRLKRQDNDEPLVVDNLLVDGLINGFSLKHLIENTLKVNSKETQNIQGEITFDRVKANWINVHQNEISNKKLDEIIHTKGDFFLINQEIRFTEPLSVNHLNVIDRLNHITVKNGKFDILFQRARGIQVISGEKFFDSVKLLSPIILRGNIRTHSLDKMKPTVTVDDEITIFGDFIIRGNVVIEQSIQANNLFGRSTFYSVQQLIEDGLETSAEVINVPIQFLQPIKVHDVLSGTTLNGIKAENLVKLGTDEWQIVSGRKYFTGHLYIKNGLCDATEINGVNVQMLNDTMLKRNGINQVVTGSIQFKRITAETMKTNLIKLGSHSIDRLLTKNTDQEINANVRITGNVLISSNTGVVINRLNCQNPIFGVDLINLLNDSVESESPRIHFTSSKWFENITIDRLIIEGNFWQYGTSNTISTQLEAFRRGIILDGPVTFTNEFTINQLNFTGSINEVARQDFGTAWLLSETNQYFTAPQTVEFVTVDYNFMLSGKMNEWNLEYLYDQSIWKYAKQNVYFKHVHFEHIKVEGSVEMGGKLSGIKFPDDLILRASEKIQNVDGYLKFDANLTVHKTIEVIEKINGINFTRMCELISPEPDSKYGLLVYGDAYFDFDPQINYLNDVPFSELVETAWFLTDSFVDLSATLFFNEAIFSSTINLTGVVNGWDLLQLRQRYFSLTKPQEIKSLVQFRSAVNIPNSLHSQKIYLKGLLQTPANPLGVSFNHLYANILRRQSGSHFITNRWEINEIELVGPLNGVRINNLNLNNDIVRYSRPKENIIYADKNFENVKINHLICGGQCTLQYVNMGEWISKTVMVYSDYVVQGITYIENPIIANVNVLGTVNNQTFNSNTILRKSTEQNILGNVYIRNKPYQVATLTFGNIYLNYINSYNFSEFYNSLVLRHRRSELNANIFSNIQFLQPLWIDDLYVDVINDRNFSVLSNTEVNHLTDQFRNKVKKLNRIRDEIDDRVTMAVNFKYLDHFTWAQTLNGINLEKISIVDSMPNNDAVFVGLSNTLNTSSMVWYEWNEDTSNLVPINVDILHPDDRIILDFTVIKFTEKSLVIIYYKDVHTNLYSHMIYLFTNRNEPVTQIFELPASNITKLVSLKIRNEHCFAVYEKHTNNVTVDCVRFNHNDRMEINKIQSFIPDNIDEIVAYETNALAVYEVDDQYRLTFWRYNASTGWSSNEKIELINKISSFDVIKFNGITYVTVCSSENDPSIVGGIRIYKHNKHSFDEIQTIPSIDTPFQCKFSVISPQELLLFVLSNQSNSYLTIFKYQGVKGFQIHSNMNKNQANQPNTVSQPRRFSLVENKHINLQLLAVSDGLETRIIKSVLN